MPEHLKALVVILALAAVVFAVAKAPACAMACASRDFERRRNLWIALTLTAFLAHNFWLYLAVATVLLLFAVRGEHNRLAMYFFVLFAMPGIEAEMPALGVFNYLFVIDHARLLALTVLLPAYLSLRKRPGTEHFGRTLADKLLAGYLVLAFLQSLEYAPFTTTLRKGVFYAFIDVFLPYYVASRSLKNLRDFRDALMSFAMAALVLSPILFFEFARFWLLYQPLPQTLGAPWGWNNYLSRAGNLRASGPIGHPIAAGYAIAVAFGFYIYLRKVVPNRAIWGLGLLLLAAGLVAPLSRGPWVGAAVIVLVVILTSTAPTLRIAKLALLALMALPVLLSTPAGNAVIDYLPFVGTIQAENVAARQVLAEVSVRLFLENPLLGNYDFIATPEMQALRGSDGIIDIVNTYVIVGLGSGGIGLSLFVGIFLVAGIGIRKGMRNLADRDDERYILGQALIATLFGTMFMIGTVSPVLVVPTIYWPLAGLGIAYARMLTQETASTATGHIERASATATAGARRTAFSR